MSEYSPFAKSFQFVKLLSYAVVTFFLEGQTCSCSSLYLPCILPTACPSKSVEMDVLCIIYHIVGLAKQILGSSWSFRKSGIYHMSTYICSMQHIVIIHHESCCRCCSCCPNVCVCCYSCCCCYHCSRVEDSDLPVQILAFAPVDCSDIPTPQRQANISSPTFFQCKA